eukprot:Nk52_evm25s229 gene=Nk52_evmTU25s229
MEEVEKENRAASRTLGVGRHLESRVRQDKNSLGRSLSEQHHYGNTPERRDIKLAEELKIVYEQLAEKEKDLILSAEIGRSLLHKKEELELDLNESKKKTRILSEIVESLKKQISSKDESLALYKKEIANFDCSKNQILDSTRAQEKQEYLKLKKEIEELALCREKEHEASSKELKEVMERLKRLKKENFELKACLKKTLVESDTEVHPKTKTSDAHVQVDLTSFSTDAQNVRHELEKSLNENATFEKRLNELEELYLQAKSYAKTLELKMAAHDHSDSESSLKCGECEDEADTEYLSNIQSPVGKCKASLMSEIEQTIEKKFSSRNEFLDKSPARKLVFSSVDNETPETKNSPWSSEELLEGSPNTCRLVKPLAGSMTLLQWKLLATPQLGGAKAYFDLSQKSGVMTRK